MGDCGMRSRRSEVGVRPEDVDDGFREREGLMKGEGGTSGADVEDVFRESQLQEQLLPALDGCDMGVNLPNLSEKLLVALFPVDGLEMAGDNALRKSV